MKTIIDTLRWMKTANKVVEIVLFIIIGLEGGILARLLQEVDDIGGIIQGFTIEVWAIVMFYLLKQQDKYIDEEVGR